MQILSKDSIDLPEKCVLTMGNFDGLHEGHRQILDSVSRLARKNGVKSLLVTYSPHPALFFRKAPLDGYLITSIDKKAGILEELSIDCLYIADFDQEFADMSSYDFIKDFLVDKFNPLEIVVGYDHFFGKNRTGSFDLISKHSREFGYKTRKIEEFRGSNGEVSSNYIRRLIKKGNVKGAEKLLGRRFSFYGKVVKGKGVGKSLSFPTANIEIDQKTQILPKNGVYSTEIIIKKNKKSYNSVCNIGVRPTFNHDDYNNRSIEVHILSDYDFDIYGYDIDLIFNFRIRDEIKFNSKEELINQINLDKEYCINSFK